MYLLLLSFLVYTIGCTSKGVEERGRGEESLTQTAEDSGDRDGVDNTQGTQNTSSTKEGRENVPQDPKTVLANKLIENPLADNGKNVLLISEFIKSIDPNNAEEMKTLGKMVDIFVKSMLAKNIILRSVSTRDRDPIAIALDKGYEGIAMKLFDVMGKPYCLDDQGKEITYFDVAYKSQKEEYVPSDECLYKLVSVMEVSDVLALGTKNNSGKESVKSAFRLKLYDILKRLCYVYLEIREIDPGEPREVVVNQIVEMLDQREEMLTKPEIAHLFIKNISEALSLIDAGKMCFFVAPTHEGVKEEDNIYLSLNETFSSIYFKPIIFYMMLTKDLEGCKKIASHLNIKDTSCHRNFNSGLLDSLMVEINSFSRNLGDFWLRKLPNMGVDEPFYASAKEVIENTYEDPDAMDVNKEGIYVATVNKLESENKVLRILAEQDVALSVQTGLAALLAAKKNTLRPTAPITPEGETPKVVLDINSITNARGTLRKTGGTGSRVALTPKQTIIAQIEQGQWMNLESKFLNMQNDLQGSLEILTALTNKDEDESKKLQNILATNIINKLRKNGKDKVKGTMSDFISVAYIEGMMKYQDQTDKVKEVLQAVLKQQVVDYLNKEEYGNVPRGCILFDKTKISDWVELLNALPRYNDFTSGKGPKALEIRGLIISVLLDEQNKEAFNTNLSNLDEIGKDHLIDHLTTAVQRLGLAKADKQRYTELIAKLSIKPKKK